MSHFKFICVLASLFIIASCGNSPQRGEPILDENYQPTPVEGTTSTTATPPATKEPAQNAEGVWHYTCPNGCAGGAGSASPCAGCGTTLVHNQGYHATGAAPVSTPVSTTAPGGIDLGTGSTINPLGGTAPTATPAAPKAPEPAQNAAGVWHYTCTDGCAGGAGSAVACAACGKTLVHNQAYHQ